jgi:hypothetical protein
MYQPLNHKDLYPHDTIQTLKEVFFFSNFPLPTVPFFVSWGFWFS